MVLHVPFLRWGSDGNPLTSSSGIASYYLETPGGEQVVAAVAIRTEDYRLIYRASGEFVEEYQEFLHLGPVVEWNYVFQLNAWLDDIVYHSFVRHSTAGVPSFWYFKALSMSTVVQRLPRGLWQHFPSGDLSTWVLLRHGSKAWPVEVVNCDFRKGWDDFCEAHGLQFEHRLILACERKWVFHAVMFDARGYEFVFDWSHPNARWHDLPLPPGDLRTACLPSAFMAHHTVLKFLCSNVYGPDLRTEFEAQLRDVFKMLSLEQMVVRMANRTWTIRILNYKLNVRQFDEFAAALHLQFLNHVMVTMLPTVEFVVIVIDGRYDSERVYDWF